jgi:hypothetical protein
MTQDDRLSGIHWMAALLAVIALASVMLGIWAVTDEDGSEPQRMATELGTTGVADARDEEPVETSQQASASRVDRCISAAEALDGPLQAARPALRQWQVHVEAMNQLVVGEITLQQATDFWNRTRLGAQRRVEHFAESWTVLRRHGVDCPSPSLMAPATPALRPCAQQVEAQIEVLEAARTSITTWRRHVRHMDMLRMGMLSPEKATEMWLAMWRRGVRELDTYERAARDPSIHAGCPEPG